MGERYVTGEQVAGVVLGVVAFVGTVALIDWLGHLDDYKETGIVHLGADNKPYVLPEGAERPVYSSLDACVKDVTAQMAAIQKATGEQVKEKPQQLCEPVDTYQTAGRRAYFPRGFFYGPIVNKDSVWKSGEVTIWQTTIADGSFAAPNHVPAFLEDAPQDAHVGDHVTLTDPAKGGFGEHGSGGFSENGSAVKEGGFGGGGEHGGSHGFGEGGGHGGGAK